jgi:predicted outer membrane repeat protein
VRVFFVHSGMTVTIDSLIITKGNGTAISSEGFTGGGGIQNNSGNNIGVALTVKNSIISGNSADNGGGIYSDGTLTITNSTLSGNTATGSGGGIYSDGTLTITGSTLSGNAATGGDGGASATAAPQRSRIAQSLAILPPAVAAVLETPAT